MVSFTTATRGERSSSRFSRARPRITGVPTVSKKADPTTVKALGTYPAFEPGISPSMATS
jgi:hypothetical protein